MIIASSEAFSWNDLPSGKFRRFANGYTGYIMNLDTEGTVWWVKSLGSLTSEGKSSSVGAAQSAIDQMMASMGLQIH